MAQQARFRNSITILLLLMLSSSCNTATDNNMLAAIPNRWVDVNDASLHHRDGAVYYNDAPFSGYTFQRFDNGDTMKQTPYYDGMQEGWMKAWYTNKQLAELRLYKHGKKEGIHKGWWSNGSPKFEYNFYNDEHEGELKEWYTNGRLARLFHYAKGYEEGAEKMWWENGDVRANYVVKDGERYGLTGQKLCSNNVNVKQ